MNVAALFRRNARLAAPRWTRRRKVVVVTGTGLALVAAGLGAYGLQHYLSDSGATCLNAGLTVVTREGAAGECVGVTDGLYQFSPRNAALVRTEDKIRAEDQRVRESGKSYVTVAYLLPSIGGTEGPAEYANQLAGAYAAQRAADGGGDVQGGAPLVQLLIASSGVDASQYRVVDADIENDMASQHLVAVAGIEISEDNTLAEVRELTAGGIPVFGSNPTSDAFDNIPGFVRVAPSNKQEISAVLAYVKPRAARAFLIEDTNPDDIYDTSLTSAFLTQFPDRTHSIVSMESFDSEGEVSPGDRIGQAVSNRISQLSSDICVSDANVVLFAGRGRDLTTLIGDLASRPCLGRPVAIVTGDDASSTSTTENEPQGLRTGVTVYYPSESDPGEWANPTGTLIIGGTNEYAQSREAYRTYSSVVTSQFGAATAASSDAPMGYDAMLTCISAIHLAGEARPAAVTVGGVSQELSALQGSRTVFGASGPIDLSGVYTGTQGSNPVGKVVPILRLSAGNAVASVDLQRTPTTDPEAGLSR